MSDSAAYQQPPSPLIRGFYPALDGLRAIAFLMVFMAHYGFLILKGAALQWGWTGVDIFFVLSGFLITGILYDSRYAEKYFSSFYVRRMLRIFPLFYGFWIAILVITLVFHIQWSRYLFATVFYMGNFFNRSTAGSGETIGPFAMGYSSPFHGGTIRFIHFDHLWSLCVEEQFYLVWPAVISVVRKRERLLWLSLAWILATLIGRELYIHWHSSALSTGVLYTSTIARSDTLVVGAALALWLRGPAPSPEQLRLSAYAVIAAAPLTLAWLYAKASVHTEVTAFDPCVSGIGYTLIALAAAGVLILALDPLSLLSRVLQNRVLVHLGKISYGLYFFHFLMLGIFSSRAVWLERHYLKLLSIAAPLSITIALAELSFRYWESPFLRLKSRLTTRTGQVADPPPLNSGWTPATEFVAASMPRTENTQPVAVRLNPGIAAIIIEPSQNKFRN